MQLSNLLFTKNSRNIVTQELLSKELSDQCAILDCGSRDGVLLKSFRDSHGIQNLVAIDFHNRIKDGVKFVSYNLEQPLPFGDGSFGAVICNDVIEHVESKKKLIKELQRISSRHVVISLPNTQYWKYIYGLLRGRMSKQYDFLVDDGVDRHRWVTYYEQNVRFVESNLVNGFKVKQAVNVSTDRRIPLIVVKAFRRYFVFNQVFLLEKSIHAA